MSKFKRLLGIFFPMLLCVLLCGCQALFPGEHTELIENGEYRPFEDPKKNIEKLMELVEAEDADYIYDVFSPAIRENTEDLYGQIQEFIRFSKESVKEWDYVKWNGSITRDSGAVRAPRISRNHLNASSGIYRCEIKEVLNDTAHENAMGFSYILIFPEELSAEYAPEEPSGIYIVYRVEDVPQNIIYCLDGCDGIKIPIHSTDELFACLQRIKAEALPVIDGIFSADVVIGGLGRISVGLDSKCILTYTSKDFEETLTSLGDETAQGETMYYFGDYTLMSNKYIIPYEQAMETLKVSVNTGELSENIKWTDKLF